MIQKVEKDSRIIYLSHRSSQDISQLKPNKLDKISKIWAEQECTTPIGWQTECLMGQGIKRACFQDFEFGHTGAVQCDTVHVTGYDTQRICFGETQTKRMGRYIVGTTIGNRMIRWSTNVASLLAHGHVQCRVQSSLTLRIFQNSHSERKVHRTCPVHYRACLVHYWMCPVHTQKSEWAPNGYFEMGSL